ncbi:hypothetical protein C1646_750211 [Rhizophagus diaphanus]|nr:hypothetical protein C1646_750211 [Rhizophagus diaphanus] [Rhizophagus sp. MUCL 43196]
MAIEKDNNRVSYLLQKAELRLNYFIYWHIKDVAIHGFLKYYYANIDKTREKVKEMIREREWNINEFPEQKKDLLNKLNIQAIDETSLRQLLEEESKMSSITSKIQVLCYSETIDDIVPVVIDKKLTVNNLKDEIKNARQDLREIKHRSI